MYDQLNGSTVGRLVGNPPPSFVPGVFGQGAQPARNSSGAAIEYSTLPPASGTLLFWVKVNAPIVFYAGDKIGLFGHEAISNGVDCDDFSMQLQQHCDWAGCPTPGLNVLIYSGPGGTYFRNSFAPPLSWRVGDIHHIAMTWGSGVQPMLYIDGVQFPLNGAALPYVSGCANSTAPFLFTASRETLDTYSPGPFVFDDFALLARPLTATEVSEIYQAKQPLFP